MPNIIGVLHPFAFQPSQIMGKISQTYEKLPDTTPSRFFRVKNLEIGTWNLSVHSNLQKNIWLFFSGVIYNEKSLMQELKQEGYAQYNSQDWLVYAFEAWGEALFKKIDGPFFIVIFDKIQERVHLSLDRMGQKSLYWCDTGSYFFFGSDIKGLLSTGLVSQNPSVSSLSAYLYFGYIPQDLSAIQSVNKLLPGHVLTLNLKKNYQLKPYWSLSQTYQTSKACSFSETCDTFGSLLLSQIKQSTSHEGCSGIELNETLGSALLNYEAFHKEERQKLLSLAAPFHSFIPQEETAKTQAWNIEKKIINLDEVLDELPKILWCLDEPVADLNVIRVWSLAKLAKGKTSHLLLATGFEELFALHERYFLNWGANGGPSYSLIQALAHAPAKLRDRWICPLLSCFSTRSAFRLLRNIDIDKRQLLYLNHTALFKGVSRKVVSPFLYPFFDPEVFVQRFHRISTLPASLNPSLYFDLKTLLPDSKLFQYERLFPLHGLQAHQIFLSNAFINLASTLPEIPELKGGTKEDFIHQMLAKGNRKFSSPPNRAYFETKWSTSPRVKKIFHSLKRGRLVEDDWINPQWIDRQLKPSEMTPLAFQQMWALLILELWFKLFIIRPVDIIDYELTTEELLKN